MRLRLQIALEYMIVFAFVLITFEFLLTLIVSQRASVMSNQLFSQLQLVSQTIAAQLNLAAEGGNGYSSSVPLTGMVGTIQYQLYVTQSGIVVANATIGNQIVQAIAYSSAKNIVSNPSYQRGTGTYLIPTANGTLNLQNSFGAICLNYAAPRSTTP